MLSSSNDDENLRQKTIQNERLKLSATYMNGLAVALVAVGGFSQIFSGRLEEAGPAKLAAIGAGILVCMVFSGLLHWKARELLKDLR